MTFSEEKNTLDQFANMKVWYEVKNQNSAVIHLGAVVLGGLCLFRNEVACIFLYSANIHGPTVRLQILFISTGFKTVSEIVFLTLFSMFDSKS